MAVTVGDGGGGCSGHAEKRPAAICWRGPVWGREPARRGVQYRSRTRRILPQERQTKRADGVRRLPPRFGRVADQLFENWPPAAPRSQHLFAHALVGFRALPWRQRHSSTLTFRARTRPSDCIVRTNETRSPTASGTGGFSATLSRRHPSQPVTGSRLRARSADFRAKTILLTQGVGVVFSDGVMVLAARSRPRDRECPR
jgi:hypothetical protein